MKAIVLAAGRGERMRPLTDTRPKPLLRVGAHALIEYPLHALAAAGVQRAVINLSWCGDQVREFLGDGRRYGLELCYSDEGPSPLETGGGIHRALALLGPAPFLVVNADVWTDHPLTGLELTGDALAQLVLVPNPAHHPAGDFALDPRGRVVDSGPRLTYAGVGLFDPALFAGCRAGRFPLKPLLDRALAAGRLAGTAWRGHWFDVGTPGRLRDLDELLLLGRLVHPALGVAAGRELPHPG